MGKIYKLYMLLFLRPSSLKSYVLQEHPPDVFLSTFTCFGLKTLILKLPICRPPSSHID
jgi:hypothetical protein